LKVIARISCTGTLKTFFQYVQSVFAAVCCVSYLPLSFTVRSFQTPNSILTFDFSKNIIQVCISSASEEQSCLIY